ncbi:MULTISPECIES: hypothetical protein [Cysteiniphilum]|uniref:Uncharacterized protein n=1 Tax=Cysteiniphilum litorale TaxID=2056700 RepID=A0A8J2Z3G0_9GAMM|nr:MULTISPECIES: hypothetical protein [Cysteiniphilum]GGF92609.1 hypothetical protein GCM10010995_07210 [Cysteiniphilum litorale]
METIHINEETAQQFCMLDPKIQSIMVFLEPSHIDSGEVVEYYFEALVNITYIIRQVTVVVDISTLELLSDKEMLIERLFKLFEVSISIVTGTEEKNIDEYIAYLKPIAKKYLMDESIAPQTKLYPVSLFIRKAMMKSLIKDQQAKYQNILAQIYYPYCRLEQKEADKKLNQLTQDIIRELGVDLKEYLKATHMALTKVMENR